jgi:hypothetical protein
MLKCTTMESEKRTRTMAVSRRVTSAVSDGAAFDAASKMGWSGGTAAVHAARAARQRSADDERPLSDS